jgi:hypothetical protein
VFLGGGLPCGPDLGARFAQRHMRARPSKDKIHHVLDDVRMVWVVYPEVVESGEDLVL